MSDDSTIDLIGRTLGSYRILREIDRGGMAIVYLAEDLKHSRQVAVKVLSAEIAATAGSARFLREIETLAKLTHPHILPLYDSGSEGGIVYYVTPYVEGESLRARLRREPQLPLADVLRLAKDLAQALDYSHDQGLLHRDIKPENILLSSGEAMLADFGIAGVLTAGGGSGFTETGSRLGTLAYMCPEQIAGGSLDRRSDVYSLGCVVYEMLAGQSPFPGPTAESVAHQHLSTPPRPVHEIRPSVPPRVSRALDRALAKSPADRHATASKFLGALEAHDGAPSRSPSRPDRRWAWASVVPILAIAAFMMVRLRSEGPAASDPRPWIVVAEFEGPADDPSLAPVARDVVTRLLTQSRLVAPVSDDQVEVALRQANMPDTARITTKLARELATRTAVRTVLEGRVRRLGDGFAIHLQVIDVEGGGSVATGGGEAKDLRSLVPALVRSTDQLLEGLAKKTTTLRSERRPLDIATTNFEVFRKVYQGDQRTGRAEFGEALQSMREAVAIDPSCWDCWTGLGFAYSNLGMADSAVFALRQSLEMQGTRIDGVDRDRLLAIILLLEGDQPGSLAAMDRVLETDSSDWGVVGNRAGLLAGMGRDEEAIEGFKRAESLAPMGAPEFLLLQKFQALVRLGRFDEASGLVQRMNPKTRWGRNSALVVALGRERWDEAETLARATLSDPTATADLRFPAALGLASVETVRGSPQSGAARLEEAVALAAGTSSPYDRTTALGQWIVLATCSGDPTLLADMATDRNGSAVEVLYGGLVESARGNRRGASEALRRFDARPASQKQRAQWLRDGLEARLAAADGRWDQTIARLRAQASGPRNSTMIGLPAAPWLLADAFEAKGEPDSAVATLEVMLSQNGLGLNGALGRGHSWGFLHRRLARLNERLGRTEQARKHWQLYAEVATRSDVRGRDPD